MSCSTTSVRKYVWIFPKILPIRPVRFGIGGCRFAATVGIRRTVRFRARSAQTYARNFCN